MVHPEVKSQLKEVEADRWQVTALLLKTVHPMKTRISLKTFSTVFYYL